MLSRSISVLTPKYKSTGNIVIIMLHNHHPFFSGCSQHLIVWGNSSFTLWNIVSVFVCNSLDFFCLKFVVFLNLKINISASMIAFCFFTNLPLWIYSRFYIIPWICHGSYILYLFPNSYSFNFCLPVMNSNNLFCYTRSFFNFS